MLPKVYIPQGFLLGSIDAQPIEKILFDCSVLGPHLAEGRLEIHFLYAKERQRYLFFAASFDKLIDNLLIHGDDVVVALQVIRHDHLFWYAEQG